MADIKDQLIKDSYNYVLQSDLSTGVVYRIGGDVPVSPIFSSGLTINDSFTYSNGTEQLGYVLTTDGTGYAYWSAVSASTPSSGVTSITVGSGLSADSSTGAVTILFTGTTGLSGSGTTGYLPKWTGSTGLGDSLVYDTTTGVTIGTGFTWDNTNTRLGIGTNTPTSPLFVYTNTTSSTIGDNNAFIIHNNNPNWATSGSSNLTELFFSDAGQGSGTANGLNLGHRYAGISAFITGWNNTNSSGGLNFITKETTASALTTKLQIRPNGNVLIGTTTDAGYKLDVNGSARSTNFRLHEIYW